MIILRPEAVYNDEYDVLVKKLANVSKIAPADHKPFDAVSFIVKNMEFYVPVEGQLNISEELDKLNRELEYTRGFLRSVMLKLSNERFVKSAPAEVVEKENVKKTDAENKIAALEKQLAGLMG